MHSNNLKYTLEIAKLVTLVGKEVMVYTGYEYDAISKYPLLCTFLKCGQYDVTKHQQSGIHNGVFTLASTNQKTEDEWRRVAPPLNFEREGSKQTLLCYRSREFDW
jgi:hypothetical protein